VYYTVANNFSDIGIIDVLSALQSRPPGYTLHLYTNNYTPVTTSVIGNFTEATFTGYAPVALSGWTSPGVTAHVASTTANPITFVATGAYQSIYGWYVTDGAGDYVCGGRDPAAPVVMSATVNSYQVTLSLTAQSA
jgi:hypothetical protein